MENPYDRSFFSATEDGARSSAEAIVPMLIDAVNPRSVVDVGCGTGAWLSVFQQAGVSDVLGLDGDYVDRSTLKISAERFRAADLSQPLQLDRTFDLAISLEVAEHLPPARSEGFVADLVAAAPVVCFGAAIPFQGGTDHVNERWQDEWAAMFAEHGYRPIDLVRRRVWDRSDVMPWYAQNMLVYSARKVATVGDDMPLRVVHPARYVDRLVKRPPITPRTVMRAAKSRIVSAR